MEMISQSIGHRKSITGNVIAVMQKMLQDQYPGVNGLQDPLNGVRLKFHVYKDTPFVQIVHDGSYHWVAVSTYSCKPGEVILMDTYFHKS